MPAGVGRTAEQGQHDLSASPPLGNTLTSLLMRPDGTLYCRNCHCTVPNTANDQMRKDGVFAHSHICGVRAPGEIYEEDTDAHAQ